MISETFSTTTIFSSRHLENFRFSCLEVSPGLGQSSGMGGGSKISSSKTIYSIHRNDPRNFLYSLRAQSQIRMVARSKMRTQTQRWPFFFAFLDLDTWWIKLRALNPHKRCLTRHSRPAKKTLVRI